MSEVATFLSALRSAESGSAEGNYGQVTGRVRGVRLVGAYGIPSDEWSQLAADAGLSGARWRDPRAQDLVMSRTIEALYQKYGDWRYVAVAWKAGERVADAVWSDPSLLKRKELAPVKDYMSQVMRHAGEHIQMRNPTQPDGTPVDARRFQPTTAGLQPTDTAPPTQKTPGDALRGILRAMKTRQMAQVDSQLSSEPAGDEPEQPGVPEEPEPQQQPGLMRRVMGLG